MSINTGDSRHVTMLQFIPYLFIRKFCNYLTIKQHQLHQGWKFEGSNRVRSKQWLLFSTSVRQRRIYFEGTHRFYLFSFLVIKTTDKQENLLKFFNLLIRSIHPTAGVLNQQK